MSITKSASATQPLNRERIFWLFFLIAVFVAIWFRIFDITLRPMHNDEGVNFHFLNEMVAKGYYPYSHENYHGPAYFYLTAIFTNIAGYSELSIRASAIVIGVLTLFLLLPLRRKAGDAFVILAAFLIAFSPSLVFYSRYAIHESLFLFGSLWLGVSLFLWADNGDRRLWFSIAAALALLICTKETFVINVAAIAVGIAAAVNPIALIRKLRAEWEYVCGGLLLLFFLVITCFSGGLRWFDGVRELFLAVPQWIGRGTSSDPGHFKPFFFYLTQMIVPTEPYLREGVLLSVALILAALFLKRWRDIFSTPYRLHRFLLVWALTIWVAYSAVPYKTPWLVINITLPLILVATLAVITLGRCGGIWKKLHYLLIALLLAVGVNNSIYFNFKEIEIFGYRFAITGTKPYGSGNPFSYVHTSPGMLELLADIEYYRRAHPKARVLVGAEQYWPLPFYFRNYPNGVGYEHVKTLGVQQNNYDVLILDRKLNLSLRGWARKYYRLSDVQESFVYFRSEILSNAQ